MKTRAFISGLLAGIVPAMALGQAAVIQPEIDGPDYEYIVPLASYALPIGPFADGKLPTLTTEGRKTQRVWKTSGESNGTLKLLAAMRARLTESGYDILFECDTKICGGFDFRFSTEVVAEPEMHVDIGDFRFLSAEKISGKSRNYVGLLVSRSADNGYIQMTSIGVAPPDNAAISASSKRRAAERDVTFESDVDSLSGQLQLHGSAVLEGLSFPKGSSSLDGDIVGSLKELADFLLDNPAASVVLVGHTDASGSLAGNVALSKKRAASVMSTLVALHGIDKARLTAEGVGYLSPRAPNDNDEGRKKNRRVEVVLVTGDS